MTVEELHKWIAEIDALKAKLEPTHKKKVDKDNPKRPEYNAGKKTIQTELNTLIAKYKQRGALTSVSVEIPKTDAELLTIKTLSKLVNETELEINRMLADANKNNTKQAAPAAVIPPAPAPTELKTTEDIDAQNPPVVEPEHNADDAAPLVVQHNADDAAPLVVQHNADDAAPLVVQHNADDAAPLVVEHNADDAVPLGVQHNADDAAPLVVEHNADDAVPLGVQHNADDAVHLLTPLDEKANEQIQLHTPANPSQVGFADEQPQTPVKGSPKDRQSHSQDILPVVLDYEPTDTPANDSLTDTTTIDPLKLETKLAHEKILVEFDALIKRLDDKNQELGAQQYSFYQSAKASRDYAAAKQAGVALSAEFTKLRLAFVHDQTIELSKFQEDCKAAIDLQMPVLENHPGYTDLLYDIAFWISNIIVVIPIIAWAVTGNARLGFFTPARMEAAKIAEDIQTNVASMTMNAPG